MAEALSAVNVSVRRKARAVVDHVSLAANHGAVVAIVGPNGAGKSTLLKAMAGLLPYEGMVRVEGDEISSLTPRVRARRIAYVPQHTLLRANISVRDMVAQGRFAHGRWGFPSARDDLAVERALELTHVAHLRAQSFARLSGGEQRRVLLARAVATEARVMLLDEPTAGLDVGHVLAFHALVRELADRGVCVVSVMHDLADVRRFADQALLLRHGRLIASGPAGEVIAAQHVREAYRVHMRENASLGFDLVESGR